MGSFLTDHRRAAAKRLLALLADDELQALCAEIHLPAGSDRNAIVEELSTIARFKALRFLLRAAEPTLLMLRDIVTFLEKHGVSARTTGCALALANPAQPQLDTTLDLSPQQVTKICTWSRDSLRVLSEDPFQEIWNHWKSLRPSWNRLLQRSQRSYLEGDMDVVETYINSVSGGHEVVYEPNIDRTDYDAQAVLKHLITRVTACVAALTRIEVDDRGASVENLLHDMRSLVSAAEDKIGPTRALPPRRSRSEEGELQRRVILRYVSQPFLDTFDRLSEDIRTLGDLSDAQDLFDILAVDLWSSRPQLYEMWLLVGILDWMERRGYAVEILQVQPTEAGRIVWGLSYSKGHQPCARISGLGCDYYAFYQLYRPSGDMPDLCVLSGPRADSPPVWAIDAKHSEHRGYTLAEYKRTAQRYRDSFGAGLSVTVEYFPRDDFRRDNPLRFDSGTALVTNACPGGPGLPMVFDLLEEVYPALKGTIVCIDYSSSFQGRRQQTLLKAIQNLRTTGETTLDCFICFAGEAMTACGMTGILRSAGETLPGPPAFQEGTSAIPLIRELRTVQLDYQITRILVIGDGEFGEKQALERIREETGVHVDLCT